MKRSLILSISAAAIAIATSCTGMWETGDDSAGYYPTGSVSIGASSGWWPGDYGYGYGYGPTYWNGTLYPGPVLPPDPFYRPEYRPVPSRPVRPNTSTGNYRPGSNRPGTPIVDGGATTLPDNRPITERPSTPSGGNVRPGNLNGSNPGIAMPPAGTGFETTRPGRH